MTWEVFALRYAHRDALVRDHFISPPDPHDGPMAMDYFVWLLRRGDDLILVDTGFSPETGLRRNRKLTRTIEAALGGLGVGLADIGDVVITHLHYDHAGNLPLFGDARFHLQEREMAYATGRHMAVPGERHAFEVEDVVAMVRAVHSDRVRYHDGDAEIMPGVSLHLVGGHTAGLQIVRVETQDGPIVLASDASHYYANMELARPYPGVFDLDDMIKGWARSVELADGAARRVIPGHDPAVLDRFEILPGSGDETVLLHRPVRAGG